AARYQFAHGSTTSLAERRTGGGASSTCTAGAESEAGGRGRRGGRAIGCGAGSSATFSASPVSGLICTWVSSWPRKRSVSDCVPAAGRGTVTGVLPTITPSRSTSAPAGSLVIETRGCSTGGGAGTGAGSAGGGAATDEAGAWA